MPVKDFDTEDLRRKLPDCVMVLDQMLKAGNTVLPPLHGRVGPLANRRSRLSALVLGVAAGTGAVPCLRSPRLLAERGSDPLRPMAAMRLSPDSNLLEARPGTYALVLSTRARGSVQIGRLGMLLLGGDRRINVINVPWYLRA